ncbi:hypothetical protein EHQ52_13510 [Leptospira koniambonensis]|uniref:Uncharacterized protein n=1 Tax=Leptospira koniambonensis TaxID=2484950 RepID=A0A4R9J4F8_9LEPT|nr:hypothetical protein [Leptospira koniambonensis]TGL32806.1 hypothetical protein EHQ52_13510 [Leptospira koniambonensis]
MKYIDFSKDLTEKGKDIFESIPNPIKPIWGSLILSRFSKYIHDIPDEVSNLFEIINNKHNWLEAKKQFDYIRDFNLKNHNFHPYEFLALAELVAKITYNSAGNMIAPFDKDSGWFIPALAFKIADHFQIESLYSEVVASVSIGKYLKNVKAEIVRLYDLLELKAIDEILWHDWDPIGINYTEQRDEYQAYSADIFDLKRNRASAEEIRKYLVDLQINRIGIFSNQDSCKLIANKIIRI